MSRIRQNFNSNAEAFINKQINMELYASYVYMSIYTYFSRDDVALAGFTKLFAKNSAEEREHAMKLIEYQTARGGRVVFADIAKPNRTEWGSPLEAVEAALDLEKNVNQSLLDLHKIAEDNNDPHLQDFLDGVFLTEQVDAIKEYGHLVARMKRAGDGLGVHLIDQELLKE